jgi:hypothetical protein
MRTKTLALSALLGLIGSASLVAQTNVYSLNAVGYINVPLYPGWNLISCPLISTPDNTIGTLLPDGGGGLATSNQYKGGWEVYQWVPALNGYTNDTASKTAYANSGSLNGWNNGGTITANPGQAIWVYDPGVATNVTFVGTVPQNGSPYLTNALSTGFNMVSSAVPMNGDLVANTNTLLTQAVGGDQVYTWEPGTQGYDPIDSNFKGSWTSQGGNDPTTTNIAEGFWYYVNAAKAPSGESWVENFAINP